MSFSPPGSFRLLDHLGNVIASGGTVAEAMAPLPDSIARKQLLLELRQLRADAAEAKETQARANAAAVRNFYDSVVRLTHRVDSFIAKRNASFVPRLRLLRLVRNGRSKISSMPCHL
jgi:hypothetical protein